MSKKEVVKILHDLHKETNRFMKNFEEYSKRFDENMKEIHLFFR